MKKCKGTGKAKDSGCGLDKTIILYGLCFDCRLEWAMTTDSGKEWLKKQTSYKQRSNEKEKRKETRAKKNELTTYNSMSLADTYFSRYIRLKYSKDGKCTCFTCGIIKDIKQVDNGHYEKRAHKSTRYHENNCRPQCKKCNGNTACNGMQKEFRIHLVNEIGIESVLEVEKLSRQVQKTNYIFFKEIADKYRVLVNEIQKEKGVKYF